MLAFNPKIPEHSLPLMTALSGGEALRFGRYLFFAGGKWLMGIGYPVKGPYQEQDFLAAVAEAQSQTKAQEVFAISPAILKKHPEALIEKDRYYILSSQAPIPTKLRNPIAKAAQLASVTESAQFTAAHRRLWSEFLNRQAGRLTGRVAELYSTFPKIAADAPGLRFLNAYDKEGNLCACLALDYNPKHFVSYVLGAHSRTHYLPHASDLLFAAMLANARNAGKRYIHLGLGVNDGIARFKKKWGAKAYFPYFMSHWRIDQADADQPVARTIALALLRSQNSRPVLPASPQNKPFAMLWKVEKNGRTSWLGGTAHFFCYSFENSFRKLFRNVDTVIFEGPLDPEFMANVSEAGKRLPANLPPLIDLLTPAERERLKKTVRGPNGLLARSLGLQKEDGPDIDWLLANAMPWFAFFTLWSGYLERLGWKESVDMEAWHIAQAMKKNVIGMETLEEQLESLSSLPQERVVRFFQACGHWKKRARSNLRAYLAGDLEKMMGSSAEFPTRTEHVVSRRDERFRQRMRPWLEQGRAAVFVGSAHLVNLRHMLREDGFTVTQKPFGWLPYLHLKLRERFRPDEAVQW